MKVVVGDKFELNTSAPERTFECIRIYSKLGCSSHMCVFEWANSNSTFEVTFGAVQMLVEQGTWIPN